MAIVMGGGYVYHSYQSDIIRTLRHNNKILADSVDIVKLNNGQSVTTGGTVYLTRDDLRNSNDSVILNMLNEFDLNVNRVEHLINAKASIRYIFKTIVKYDTAFVFGTDTVLVDNYDTWDNGFLALERIVYTDSPDTAHYKYSHDLEVDATISTYKEGKWRLRNIIYWRPKLYKTSLTANDTNVVFTDINSFFIGKVK